MALGKRLFPLFALALGLDEHYFDDKLRRPGHTMRVLYYPPQYGEIDARELGIGAHTCVGAFALPHALSFLPDPLPPSRSCCGVES